MKAIVTSRSFFNQFVLLCALFGIIGLNSCSKDTVKETIENEVEQEETSNEEPTDDPIEDPVETDTDIVFEAGVVLDVNRTFVNYVLPETEYNKFITGDGNLKLVSEKMYTYLNDDFDFLIILSVEEQQPEDLFYGRSTSVQNLVQGIGAGVYDLSATYGSAGKLKSVIYMPRIEYVKNGPFLHEISHTWANKGFLPTTVSGHWGYSSSGGQLGGFDELIDNGDGTYLGRLADQDGFGTFANGGNSLPYSNIELYVMGLIPAVELETVQVAVNPVAGASIGVFSADGIETHTKGMMISDNGLRLPSFDDSQKAFKALTVLISKSPVTKAQKDLITADLENFSRQAAPDWNSSYNFHTATQGKASFSFDVLPESIK